MIKLNDDYLSINRVAMALDISDHTIRRWYKWWEDDTYPKPNDLFLPKYYHKDRRGTKFFKKEDVPALKEFRNKIQTTHIGAMAAFNSFYQWGKRGEVIRDNKKKKEEQRCQQESN